MSCLSPLVHTHAGCPASSRPNGGSGSIVTEHLLCTLCFYCTYARTMTPHRISIEPWTVTPCIQNAQYTCVYIYHTYVSTLCTIEPRYVILLGCVCVSGKCYVCWRLPGPKCIPHKMHNQRLEIIHTYVHIQLYIHLQIGTCTVQ